MPIALQIYAKADQKPRKSGNTSKIQLFCIYPAISPLEEAHET